MEILSSNRLELRLLDFTDKYDIFEYRSQPDINRYQLWKPSSVEEVERFISTGIVREPNIPNTWMQLAIITKDTNELIGDLGIHFIQNEPDQVEIGITIKREEQRKGYATEALALIFDYVFIRLLKHRIIASIDSDNHASIKLMERMKMRKEAHFRNSLYVDGKWVDDVVYAILKEEWKKT